ncbi:Uncharacterised protein [Mycobacterium tuberculosis]|nr:Uncharacterised protein [Mycobacterium tuberculosis]
MPGWHISGMLAISFACSSLVMSRRKVFAFAYIRWTMPAPVISYEMPEV